MRIVPQSHDRAEALPHGHGPTTRDGRPGRSRTSTSSATCCSR
jgi:hypothetical protein